MNPDLAKRFIRDYEKDASCHRCQHASSREVGEDVSKFGAAYDQHPNYRDGKLWTTTFFPNEADSQCMKCAADWLQEKKDAGKVCNRCTTLVTKKNPAVIRIETRDADTKRLESRKVICGKCFSHSIELRSLVKG
jgi:hypothetical protein